MKHENEYTARRSYSKRKTTPVIRINFMADEFGSVYLMQLESLLVFLGDMGGLLKFIMVSGSVITALVASTQLKAALIRAVYHIQNYSVEQSEYYTSAHGTNAMQLTDEESTLQSSPTLNSFDSDSICSAHGLSESNDGKFYKIRFGQSRNQDSGLRASNNSNPLEAALRPLSNELASNDTSNSPDQKSESSALQRLSKDKLAKSMHSPLEKFVSTDEAPISTADIMLTERELIQEPSKNLKDQFDASSIMDQPKLIMNRNHRTTEMIRSR